MYSRKAYYSSLEARELITEDELKRVGGGGDPVSKKDLRIRPLRVGLNFVGALGLEGGQLSLESLVAIGSLVAISIERAGAVEKLAHSEAGRESERLRSILLDSVTHDFRTPLTSIKASAQAMLESGTLDESARRELLTVINEESDRLDRLVGEAARMAQLDAHAVELDLKPHDIREAIESEHSGQSPGASRGAGRVAQGGARPAPYRGDPLAVDGQRRQVLSTRHAHHHQRGATGPHDRHQRGRPGPRHRGH
jgi:K+-sensing histidine kinase KdpD